jgi:hypothetical protein
LGLGLGWGCSLGFSSLDFSTGFPKSTFPEVITSLIGFWKSFVCGGNTSGAGVVSSRFLRWLGFGGKSFLWWVFGGSLLMVKIRQPSHEFTFGVGMSFIPYPLVLTPVV